MTVGEQFMPCGACDTGESRVQAEVGEIRVKGVSFAYGRKLVLKNVSLDVPAGTVAALVGPNGAGKSTLLKVISGYLRPSEGEVLVSGKPVHRLSSRERSRLITYTGHEPRPSFEFTVEETVRMGRTPYVRSVFSESKEDLAAARAAMRAAFCEELANRAITSLSSGELQRVHVARAICQDPEVFLLDEPTAHLDLAFELLMMELVSRMAQERKKTVLAVFHDLNLAVRYASVLFFMKDGSLVHSLRPDQLSKEIIRDVYNVDADLVFHPATRSWRVVPVSAAVRPATTSPPARYD
ncbi:MAG: ABC transporter ATP-binding protein [Candidatus Fermentithermobacillus carboniphilus]|uniref:ABC transporter ATP-binding protein n=1 Tax=Candidatus Fermentithermobacillus carboniphilus TaxID=3085328 RepID=A0AAT9LDG1_9FIRM|nr:MAG: ABC transporter ATP-binding protein [Candidatus Fermentithermobacillus carboniphilus]